VRSVTAADRVTRAFKPEDIPIHETLGPDLPFANHSFDVVVYNHVIEHVGQRSEQARSIHEIRRVLRPEGFLYLAVPNRWTIIEPHYRLPFLSWLPARLANAWVKALGRNVWYDCNPFGHGELLQFLADAGFTVEDVTDEAFYRVLEIEMAHRIIGRLLARTPRFVLRAGVLAMPTFVIIARARDN
jgi:SAM-dependent methyltransferase